MLTDRGDSIFRAVYARNSLFFRLRTGGWLA